MLVGIVSDTHGTLPLKAEDLLTKCDHIVHAGDICGPDILRQLRRIAPTTAVMGNNDFREYGDDVDKFAHVVLDGVLLTVTHYPQKIRPRTEKLLKKNDEFADSAGEIVAVHGHTHTARLETGSPAAPAGYLICPGSLAFPRTPAGETLGFAEVESGVVKNIWIEDLDGRRVL